ncbi:MAG: MFS transporter [bacterium]
MGFWNNREDKPTLVTGTHAFYINALLRGLVMSLVGVFTPIFVYREVVQISDVKTALICVAGYYLLLRLTVFVSSIPISWIIERLGFRKSILVSMVLLICNLLTLSLAGGHVWLIPISSILAGLVAPFYWIARHSAVSQDAVKSGMGRTMGVLATMESLSSLLSPFVGGVIIMEWGYPVLYAISAVLLVLSIVPLWYMPHHTHRNGASINGFAHYLRDKRYFHQEVGMMGLVGHDYGLLIIWPLLMSLMHYSTKTVGGVYSIIAAVWVAFRLITGNLFDKLHNKKGLADETLFAISSIGVFVFIVARIWITSIEQIVVLEIATAFFSIIFSGFLLSYFQLGGRRMGSIAYYVYSEMIYSIFAVVLMVIMMLGAEYNIWREIIMMVCASWVLISVVVARESNLK